MDAGFFRVSRSAGIWGEGRGFSGRPGRKLKLEAECLEGGASKIHRILSASRLSLLPCGGDRCAPAQSPPPGSSPLRGGDGRRKMAAGMSWSGTSPLGCVAGPAG